MSRVDRDVRTGDAMWDAWHISTAGPSSQLQFVEGDTVVRLGDQPGIKLTPTQFRVLRYLAEHGGRWISRQELLCGAFDTFHRVDGSLLRVYIHQLRRALGPNAAQLETDRRGRLG